MNWLQTSASKVSESDEIYIKGIYRLARDKDAIKNELRFFKDKGVIVHVFSFPQTSINVDDEHQKSIMELVNNLFTEVSSFMTKKVRKIFDGDKRNKIMII